MEWMTVIDIMFFFSSRGQHTIYWRDWISDVCSSDLHAERADSCQLDPVASPHVVGQGRDALLHPCPDGLQRVRPPPLDELVLPVGAADRERRGVRADEHGLDPGRPQLDPQGRAPPGDRLADVRRHLSRPSRPGVAGPVPRVPVSAAPPVADLPGPTPTTG